MHELISYLLNPVSGPNKKPNFKYFLFLFFIGILASVALGAIGPILFTHFHLIKSISVGITWQNKILFGVIIAPIVEEIIFRSLLRFKIINIILFSITITVYSILAAYHSKLGNFIFGFIILVSLITLLTCIPIHKIELYFSSKFKWFFYGTTLIFGLIHIFNYSGNIYILMAFSLIITSPQIVGGLILGYVRMNYGLIYSILFHISKNAFILFILSRILYYF